MLKIRKLRTLNLGRIILSTSFSKYEDQIALYPGQQIMSDSTQESGSSVRRFFNLVEIKALFNLGEDQANRFDVIEEVRQNVAFRGTNLWILIFAIIICSVGLNVNSTAVIIGAMLISPLMGPINGLGVGAGTFDMKLIRRSLKNIGIAVVISVLSSALYFFISPLDQAQSELLARTAPTLYDVIIALFGGLSGIIAATRNEKTNVIPGVAIATALMPPLCTAGYGIATGQLAFFAGALYLFFINTVFISFSAWLMVRFMNFPVFDFVDAAREKRVRQFVTILVLFTTIPSIYYAYTLVNDKVFEQRAQNFVSSEFDFPGTHVIETLVDPTSGKRSISVYLMGETIDEAERQRLAAKMSNYKCDDAELKIIQGKEQREQIDVNSLSKQVFEDLYKKSEETIRTKEDRIKVLEKELENISAKKLPMSDIINEAKASYPSLVELTLNKNVLYTVGSEKTDTALVALVKFNERLPKIEQERFSTWVKARTKMDSVIVVLR